MTYVCLATPRCRDSFKGFENFGRVRVQPALFPRVGFGMANNPWALAYAAGGEWMVAIFVLTPSPWEY
jgi:hypothetical protein